MKELVSVHFLKALAVIVILIDITLPFIYSIPIGFSFLAVYYFFAVCQKPTIHTGNPNLKSFLIKNVPSIHKKFYPSPLYWEGRLQTIFGLRKRISSSIKIPYKREILQLSDGGQIGIDYIESDVEIGNVQRLTVLILPGLTSSSQTSYVKTLVLSILSAGANVIVYNTRGLGGVPLLTPKWACAAYSDDIRTATAHIKANKLRPGEKLFVIGCSFGGMVLCQMLLNHPEESREAYYGSLVISTIFDMQALLNSLSKPYFNKYILNQGVTLDILYRAKKFPSVLESRPEAWDFAYACKATTLSELDRRLTVPMFGYESCEEYYRRATTVGRLRDICIPMFVLNALDDPMQPGDALPLEQTKLMRNTNVAFITTARGGHLGFVEGVREKQEHFMERFVKELVQAVISNKKVLQRVSTNSA